jgi:predicted MPP superfamily phosphohydrolase
LLISLKFTIKRLNALIILLSIPFITTLYGVINANIIRSEAITIHNEHLLQNTVIAHLSDIHIGPFFQKGTIQSIVSKVNEMNADIIVITGDMVDGHIDINGEWLEPLTAIHKPILFVSGNHEKYFGKEKFIAMLKQHTHVTHLSNYTVTYNGINFIGVDYEYSIKDMLRYIMEQDASLGNDNAVNVLLNHVPLLMAKELEEFNVFLNLVGHTHAGQFFPLQIPVYLGNVLYNGLYSYNDKHYAYVSSGIGANTIPMRVLSKSKIVKVNLINPNINNNNNNNSIIIS